MTRLLEVTDLRVRFNTPEGIVHAVNGISYHLDEGEVLAVVGESGSGKSVSMMSILGLIPSPPGEIISGRALYQGQDLLQLDEDELEQIRGREIGMIFQDPMTSLNPVLSIERQMTEALLQHFNMPKSEAKHRALELFEMVRIPDPANRLSNYPHQFSGGMRQRVMIAMMLACNPSILIADEPTTALDVTIQAQIVDLIQEVKDKLGMALIWITHDLGVVASIADRVAVMYAGRIVEEADVDTIYEEPNHPYTKSLLAALPRIDQRRGGRLKAIPGTPPNQLVEPRGCSFAPRCDIATDRCWSETPPLIPTTSTHQAACWLSNVKVREAQ